MWGTRAWPPVPESLELVKKISWCFKDPQIILASARYLHVRPMNHDENVCRKIGTWPYNKFIGLSLFIIIITSI